MCVYVCVCTCVWQWLFALPDPLLPAAILLFHWTWLQLHFILPTDLRLTVTLAHWCLKDEPQTVKVGWTLFLHKGVLQAWKGCGSFIVPKNSALFPQTLFFHRWWIGNAALTLRLFSRLLFLTTWITGRTQTAAWPASFASASTF